jgi:hypothetical protein
MFVTRVTGPVQLAEKEAYPSGVPELTRFIGVRVTKSLVFCVVFCPFVFSRAPVSWRHLNFVSVSMIYLSTIF